MERPKWNFSVIRAEEKKKQNRQQRGRKASAKQVSQNVLRTDMRSRGEVEKVRGLPGGGETVGGMLIKR